MHSLELRHISLCWLPASLLVPSGIIPVTAYSIPDSLITLIIRKNILSEYIYSYLNVNLSEISI